MKLALIDYGSGNIHSVSRAISHAATQAGISLSLQLTDDPDQIYQADRIVLPGVGHFADCYRSLTAIDGLVGALTEAVLGRAVPFLGICVGMQLLADYGREGGAQTASLGWIGGVVDRLPSRTADDKDCREVAKQINQQIETWIRQHPGQWLWPHRRWGKIPPAQLSK